MAYRAVMCMMPECGRKHVGVPYNDTPTELMRGAIIRGMYCGACRAVKRMMPECDHTKCRGATICRIHCGVGASFHGAPCGCHNEMCVIVCDVRRRSGEMCLEASRRMLLNSY
jgi:hypothetical protein